MRSRPMCGCEHARKSVQCCAWASASSYHASGSVLLRSAGRLSSGARDSPATLRAAESRPAAVRSIEYIPLMVSALSACWPARVSIRCAAARSTQASSSIVSPTAKSSPSVSMMSRHTNASRCRLLPATAAFTAASLTGLPAAAASSFSSPSAGASPSFFSSPFFSSSFFSSAAGAGAGAATSALTACSAISCVAAAPGGARNPRSSER
mmetsp:Transcript_10956/g.33352  ORF Transcript_10956/g.33352 Transcript_10956/m.33352 type:complete len:209 (+) Transcript_10956:1923-2549(+)